MYRVAAAVKTLVVGLGATGLSVVRYLRAQGVVTAVTDSRSNPPGLARLREDLPEVAVFVGGFDPEVFGAADRLVISPGVPLAQPLIQDAIARGAEVLGDIALFAGVATAPICAITGSNGKSTVTTLVGEMAAASGRRVAVGGNLGEPALALLDAAVELYVLELSSFQLETTNNLNARVAAVLNLSADHMDRYANLAAYAAAKQRIFQGARIAVVNRDDPWVMGMPRAVERDIGFTLSVPEGDDFGLRHHAGELWICAGRQPLMPAAAVRIAGRHNLANALAALALAHACEVPIEPACEVLRRFNGLPHRGVLVTERDGVRWYDDSKGTNPGATIAALTGLVPSEGGGRVVLIAGGDGKGADFEPLVPAVAKTARAVVLIGRDAARLAAVLTGVVKVVQATGLPDAVEQAARLARPGDVVLLSPACASFDMFDDYAHRGRMFAECVGRLEA